MSALVMLWLFASPAPAGAPAHDDAAAAADGRSLICERTGGATAGGQGGSRRRP